MPGPHAISPPTFKQKAKRLLLRIQGKRVLHFLHVGKTGGTAIKHALRPYAEGGRFILKLHRHGVRLTDVPAGDGFFFFVRDPIGRFVSGFHSRQRQGQPRYFSAWSAAERRAFEFFNSPNDLAVSLSSRDSDRRERAIDAMRHVGHVKWSYWDWFKDEEYFTSRISDIFFIGFQNKLAEDFDVLKSTLRLPANLRLPEDDFRAHKNPAGLNNSLSAEAIENLKAWYKSDYRFVSLCERIAAKRPSVGSRLAA